ncbi:SET domain-containing protein [Acrodontium crateriforme]|uniref:SET domain-containing protein n=1 Tax=Acrodontium crateriforme TaxID=150365 RepID=A0AAQ3RBI0_9PEZI|nr:SET domain-containing protein [Acrodontium crateriforme]
MLIRRGKDEGWLTLSSDAFATWASLYAVDFKHVKPGIIPGRGGALVATEDLPGSDAIKALMTVPKDIILSMERVHEHAKVDQDFREVLESLGDFGRNNLLGHRTPRGAILTFILMQASMSCPHLPERVGVHSPFSDYVKSLHLEMLPTFWTPSELQLLVGTTLAPAISSKLKSLHREYELLCELAADTRWFRLVQDHLDFDDWLQVDAMYRSRALDFPEIGHCVVPCIDLANHSAGERSTALYEKDQNDDAVLLFCPGKNVKAGDEVTITYGDEKGACEMLFSYGFLEDYRESAEMIFLSLTIPDTDSMRQAKLNFADCAPGFKLIDTGDGEIDWKGEYIWLLCVNEEDGLEFKVARTVDGSGEEIHVFFKDQEIRGGAAELYSLLGKSELWDVYRLRAIAILQSRVFDQLQVLFSSQEATEATLHGQGTDVRGQPFEQAMKLRQLEFELLERAYEDFEKQKVDLAESDRVQKYLAQMTSGQDAEDDFS